MKHHYRNMPSFTKSPSLIGIYMALFCATVGFAQTFLDDPQAQQDGQVITDPSTGQEYFKVSPGNSKLSDQEAATQANRLTSALANEVERRSLIRQSTKEKGTFSAPVASPFLYNYDRILRSQSQNLSEKIPISAQQVLDIHVSWLINRHIDLLSQLKNSNSESNSNRLKNKLQKVLDEMDYLNAHPAIDARLKKMITDHLKKINENPDDAGKPNPEIYFIRGMVSKCCFSYDIAILDFLEGFECVDRDPTLNSADYIIYFPEIQIALSKSKAVMAPVDKNSSILAQDSFAYGFSAFWEGEYKEAIIHFSDAILENGQVPIYWYYRALAWKRLGETDKAEIDANSGTAVERELFGRKTPVIGFYLQRIQGAERKWLEYKRIGFK